MSNLAVLERPTAPTVTGDEMDLIRRTVANGATDDELKLFLFDCARRGVHPLDKMLHFTKRQGKYTPVTSIDFMRSQAASTGEMAGSDDPVFQDWNASLSSATVTVYRLTQGQRFAYTATARWDEYCPEPGPSGKGDIMWRKMPYTMLGKCAEALALRKAFPQQLAGLYAREEMDQAEQPSGYSVTAPAAATVTVVGDSSAVPPAQGGGDPGRSLSHEVTQHGEELPDDGQLYVVRVDITDTKNPNVKKATITLSDSRQFTTIKPALQSLCSELCAERVPVQIWPEDLKATKWGTDLLAIHRAESQDVPDDDLPPLTDSDIPFLWLLPLVLPCLSFLA